MTEPTTRRARRNGPPKRFAEQVSFPVPAGTRDRLHDAAEASGTHLAAFCRDAIAHALLLAERRNAKAAADRRDWPDAEAAR